MVDQLESVKTILMSKEIYALPLDRPDFYCHGCLFWTSVMFVNIVVNFACWLVSIARLCVCLRQEGDDGIEARSDSSKGGGEEGGPSAAVTPQRRGDCCLKTRLGKHCQ